MKKRVTIKPHKDNIFLFPNVDKLLMDKGLDSIKNKRFTEAIEFLEKAQELDEDNEEIALGLIIAYFESGNLLVAKQLARESLQKGLGDYFQLIDFYIMILLQLNEYEEIVTTIQALIEEREVPSEKFDNLTKILEFSKRKLDAENSKLSQSTLNEESEFDLLQLESLNEQFLAVAKLMDGNVRNYLTGIKNYLQSNQGHPFLKTMLIQLLVEQEVNEEIIVEKFHVRHVVNPVLLAKNEFLLETNGIIETLKKEVEQKDPTLYESIKAIVNRHIFLLFPEIHRPDNHNLWVAAYHYIGLEYQGSTVTIEKIAADYLIESKDILEVIAFIRELEEISSPII